MKKVLSRGRSGKWRSQKACIPSHIDSSERRDQHQADTLGGRSENVLATANRAATPVALSLAPGTVSRRADVREGSRREGGNRGSRLDQRRATRHGSASDHQGYRDDRGHQWRAGVDRSISQGKRPNTSSGIAG